MIWFALAIVIATALVYPRAMLWALVATGLGWFGALVLIVYLVACAIFAAIIFVVGCACGVAWQVWQLLTRRTA